MIMSYDDYMKIVPKETAEFVNLVLKMFDKYIDEDCTIQPEYYAIEHLESKIFAILLGVQYYQGLNDTTMAILYKCGLEKDFINKLEIDKVKKIEVNYNYIFNKNANIFCPFNYYENYMYLIPESIIYNAFKDGKYQINQIGCIFENNKWRDIFFNQYKSNAENIEKKKEKIIENEVYKDLSYDVINYLEKVSLWFGWFRTVDKTKYNREVLETYADLTVASLIFALYNTNNKIAKFFENKGISESKCREFFIKNQTGNPSSLPASCATIIRQFVEKYLTDGLNKEIARKDLTVEKIIRNIFDRDFTNSLVLEKILYQCNLSITDFSDFENKLQDFEKNYEFIKKQKEIEEFYGNTNQKTIEFIEFVTKVHQLIKNNFDNNKIEKKYIHNEGDISILAFFISSYFVNNDFINYFKDNGITIENICQKLGINITKDEILKMEADIDIVLNNYKNFIFKYTGDGENADINTVLYSLGNGVKNNSNCILALVKDINPNLRITNNFTDLIINYNENKEKLRKYKLEQEFFGDMNKSCVKFLKKVSITYQKLENSDKTTQFSRDDLIEIAIYYEAVELDEGLRSKFLQSLYWGGGVLFSGNQTFNENIDIIYNYFGKYVFDGKNKDKKKNEITIKDIYTNIFNKEVNNSLALYKFLADIGFCVDKFNNFDESFLEYENKHNIESVKNAISDKSYRRYLENLSKIYNHLFDMSKDGNFIYDTNSNIDEIKNVSQLLALLLEKDNVSLHENYARLSERGLEDNKTLSCHLQLLSKRGITLDNYLKYINLDKDEFNKYETREIDYLTIYENFCYKFHEGLGLQGIIEIVKDLFHKNENKYRYENFIKYLGESPEIIEKEMKTGEEVVVQLSKEEQLNYLTTMPINKLDYNLNSISSFGRELADHSIIIANEFVNIAMQDNDNNNNRVLDIKEEISKLTKKPKQNPFARKKSVNEKIAHNKEILDSLNEILKENETRMLEVIEHFGYLKKLIAVYVYRLNSYIDELKINIDNFDSFIQKNQQNILETLDNETIKRTLCDKLNDYQKSLVISLQQYQKINILLNNYLINLSKTSTARNTTIPNLYIELSIRDSIRLEQDSVSDLNDINNLLNSIVNTNNELLDKNIFKGENGSINTKDLSGEIRKVLGAENLIIQDNDEKTDANKSLVKKNDMQ